MRQLQRIAIAVLGCALGTAGHALAGPGLLVGAAEDAVKQRDLAAATAKMDLARLAGMNAIRVTAVWSPGRERLEGDDLVVLRNAATAAQLAGLRIFVSTYPTGSRATPLTRQARAQFASFAASIPVQIPYVRDVIVGNEPNLNRFWMPQFNSKGQDAAAPAYHALLAETYDALKAVSPDVNVIGGSVSPRGQDEPHAQRQTHSPTAFIRHLGEAYRASGRTLPIMDMFAFHPYLESSRLPPTFRHPKSTSISINDYDKLVDLLGRAFDGTAQRGSSLPIVFDEFGVQSQVGGIKARQYTNRQAPASRDAVSEQMQAAYYRQALQLAACQPTVAALLIFHVSDENDLRAWQSGLYYADDTPKSSLAPVRDAFLAARAGTLGSCPRG
jgi:hypothetical protein